MSNNKTPSDDILKEVLFNNKDMRRTTVFSVNLRRELPLIKEAMREAISLARAEALKDVLKITEDWDVEPCCHGIMQDELIREIKKLGEGEVSA